MRINFFGGPSAGKSTTSAWLFSELKMNGYSVEQVTEYVKSWAYLKREIKYFDQIYLFGKQMQYEYRFLEHGAQNIVTDSPVFLSYCYAKKYYPRISSQLLLLCKEYDSVHRPINIFLERKDKPYDTQGRYQSKEEAMEIDRMIKFELSQQGAGPRIVTDYKNRKGIYDFVTDILDNK